MNYMWDINDCFDEVHALYQVMEERKITDPQERELCFLALMKHLGKKPIGATELTKEELFTELTSKGQKILSIEQDEQGKPIYKFIKKKEEDN